MNKNKEYDGSTPIIGTYAVLQEAFVDNLIAGLTQYEAYQKAGYKGKNEGIIRSNASTALKTNQNIRKRLAYKRAQLAKRNEITQERIVKEFAKVGFANIADFYDDKDKLKPLNGISRANLAAVSSIEQEQKGRKTTTKVKLHSKLQALDALGKHLGLYELDNEQKRASIFDTLAIVGLRRKQVENRVIEGKQDG